MPEEEQPELGIETVTEEQKQLIKIAEKRGLSSKELDTLLKSVENSPRPKGAIPYEDYIGGRRFKIGIISDTHIGHKDFREDLFEHAGKVFKRDKVKRIYHAGDILEGMSGRDGHVYELDKMGFQQQIEYAAWLMKEFMPDEVPIGGINGNHDLWYAKRNNGGVDVAAELEQRVPNFTNLGSEEADVEIANGVTLKLFHPNDGTAYATSYKLQKLIESFEGGKKPEIVAEGHYHKALYMFLRNVHGLECGTLCGQTGWMRGKKIPAHMGFWTLGIEPSRSKRGGVGSLEAKFYPAYD